MDITLKELTQMQEPLKRLVVQVMPMKAAWKLSRLVRLIESELRELEDRRVELVKEMGEPMKYDPNNFRILPDKMGEFQERYNKLQEDYVDISQLNINDFALVNIPPIDMFVLEKLFTE